MSGRVSATPAPVRKPPSTAATLARLSALAGLAHIAADGLASRLELTTPPHLLLRHAPEVFRDFLDPVGVSIAASLVGGVMSALVALAFEDRPRGRRARPLAVSLAGRWLLSGGLFAAVYLSAPWSVVVGSLAAGIPRAVVVAWLLDRVMPVTGTSPAAPV